MKSKGTTITDFAKELYDLTELEYLTVEAYSLAIKKISNYDYKSKLEGFKKDHERHIKELTEILKSHREEFPTGPKIPKKWIVEGEIIVADLTNDGEDVLQALRKNEIDTNTAYKKICNYNDNSWEESREVLLLGLNDERRHKTWMDKTLG